MKTVFQTPGDVDCGAACVAMLLDWSLDEARFEIYGKRNAKRTSTNNLRDALKKHLKVNRGPLRRMPSAGLRSIHRHALVYGKRNDGGGHWMVWDAKEECLRDPEGFSASIKVTSFLSVGGPIQ